MASQRTICQSNQPVARCTRRVDGCMLTKGGWKKLKNRFQLTMLERERQIRADEEETRLSEPIPNARFFLLLSPSVLLVGLRRVRRRKGKERGEWVSIISNESNNNSNKRKAGVVVSCRYYFHIIKWAVTHNTRKLFDTQVSFGVPSGVIEKENEAGSI